MISQNRASGGASGQFASAVVGGAASCPDAVTRAGRVHLSFGFTLVYGYIAARVRHADKVMLPLLDILQSIPVLGFMPGLVLALAAMFPTSNVGLELAAVVMIFTGQVCNMTAVPPPLAPAPRRARRRQRNPWP